MAKRQVRGQGFSLYGLQGEISQAVDILSDALAKQGVEVNQDSLLLQIQNVVKSVGEGYATTSNGYAYMQASDEAPPYSVAGDLLAVGYNQFKIGDKKEGIKNIIAAMSHDDFDDIAMGLLAMNAKSVEASSEDTDESEDEGNNEEDVDDNEDSEDYDDSDSEDDDEDEDEDDDLDDDEIDGLLQDDEVTANDDNSEVENDEEEEEEEQNTNKLPAKKPMAEEDDTNKPVPMTASQRAIANKLSMSGDKVGRSKSKEFVNTVVRKTAA